MVEKVQEKKENKLPHGYVMGRDVGVEMFKNMCHELGLNEYEFTETDDGEDNKNKIVHAFCSGHLEFENFEFKLTLKTPIDFGKKSIATLVISEPDGGQMREMSTIKKKNDDFGKALAVLGAVTKIGIHGVSKLKGRDLMVAVAVISFFL